MSESTLFVSKQVGDRHVLQITVPTLTDRDIVQQLERAVVTYLQAHQPSRWVLDCRDVRFITSEMLSSLLRFRKISGEFGGAFELDNLATPVRDVLRVTKLDSLLSIASSGPGASQA